MWIPARSVPATSIALLVCRHGMGRWFSKIRGAQPCGLMSAGRATYGGFYGLNSAGVARPQGL